MELDYTGCVAVIYDDKGSHLTTSNIWGHDQTENYIEIKELDELVPGDLCETLILTAPMPRAYKGRVHIYLGRKIIRLFQGQNKEIRRETRYKIEIPVIIEFVGKTSEENLRHTAIQARTVNISKSGIRIRTPRSALAYKNRLMLRMKIGNDEKLLTADVVNFLNKPECSEYGCKLVNEG